MKANLPPVYAGPDADRVGFCDVCRHPVYIGEKHYRMPDGVLLCDDYMCLEEWAKEYEEWN